MNTDYAALATASPLLEEELVRRQAYRFRRMFPDCLDGCQPDSPKAADHVIRPGYQTPVCRRLYPKHLAWMRLGTQYPEKLFLKANRIGGTEAAAYETTCHLTGLYPHWWEGRRFEGPGEWWVAGDTSKTVRDICQVALLGDLKTPRTGMIPGHLVVDMSRKPGVPDAYETIWVQHVEKHHGGPVHASVQLKSYDQKREAFQGTAKQGVWLDEEPPEDIAAECAMRTMTTDGLMLLTFTPLSGLTPYVQEFLEQADLHVTDDLIVSAKDHFWQGTDKA